MSFEFSITEEEDDNNHDFHALSHRLAHIYQKLTNLDKRIKEEPNQSKDDLLKLRTIEEFCEVSMF